MAAPSTWGPKSLNEYLKRYESNGEEELKKKKKRKKKVESKPDARGVLVVDEDPVWQKPVNLEEENDDSADEEKPQVDEDIEVKRMRRLEELRARRPYNAISDDGSGWISLSPNHAKSSDPNSDMSPPRKQRVRNDTPSPEPELKPSDSGRDNTDLSPPRQQRKHHHTPSPDISPPRRGCRDSPYQDDFRASLGSDLSPPRKSQKDVGRNGSPDLSPLRRRRIETNASGASLPPDLSPPRKSRKEAAVKEQPKTGLVSGQDISEEIARTKKNDLLRFNKMDPSISGRGAEPVYRDRIKGERISKEEFLKSRQKVKVEEKPKEVKLEWGKGLAQKREAEGRLQELELEKDKPFARTRDDPELDNMMKERLRWGDPMAHLVKKKHPELNLLNLGDSEKMKESGFIIPQDIPNHSWLKRGLDAAPNRYGIRPGRHWDGVDRSNGQFTFFILLSDVSYYSSNFIKQCVRAQKFVDN
jgi:pre-mRNA-splicing factor CWC26